MSPPKSHELLIAAVTPSFLDKEAGYFSQNLEKIRRAAKTQRWWQEHTVLLEENQKIKISELLRRVADMGYEKTQTVSAPGEFSQRGGFITIWPINESKPWQIEYLGNVIEQISPAKFAPAEKAKKPTVRLGELARLQAGDYVVHFDHGVGIFRGFVQSPDSKKLYYAHDREHSTPTEKWFFVIEYAPPKEGRLPDRLLVPIEQAKKLSSYYGFETPTVHRLGSELWIRTKRKIKEEVITLARELLALYAKREVARRPPYASDPALEKELAASFPYVETDDQIKAVKDIGRDLADDSPMDRLLVGDVGFGKTEVALRAAFKAVLAGKQVAVLAPTTILARQHAATFKERLKGFPVEIAELSRLTPRREAAAILKKLPAAAIDILVGTHKILSPAISFKDLGLLIIDEEQRFGVNAKEKLKQLRAQIDILALSATPIPRTMHLALAKLRDMSVIETPPPGRIPIKTYVLPYAKRTVQEALANELKRKGQAFVLSNRIETLMMRAREVRTLVPKARIAIVYGRLPEGELIETMEKFRNGKIDVLVATTIIENGLDISNVNTLIVTDATRLGLGEAHQLRGRVGRGDTQAYAYFLRPARVLAPKAKARLETLKRAAHLGAGYEIALKDLEIRGAGNILGKEQSGAINAIGLNLYTQMLSETIETLRK